MKLREHLEDDVVVAQARRPVEGQVRPEAVRVREERALRLAGRPRRVDEQQRVVVARDILDVAVETARIGDPALEADGEVDDVAEDGDPLLLVYTSGMTGKPKGALLTHANCFWTNLSFDLATGISQHDVVLQVLPQFHCGGWNVQPLLAWWKGARVVLERAFDAARALELIESCLLYTSDAADE